MKPPVLEGERDLARPGEPEVARHHLFQPGPRTSAVTRPNRRAKTGLTDIPTAAPVPGDLAERGEPRGPTVGRDAGRIDAGAADHPDPHAVPSRPGRARRRR